MLVGIGCSHSGDVGAFLVTEVEQYGGRTRTSTTLPEVEAKWTVKRDDDGFTARVNGTSFEMVDGFMKQAFGPPDTSVDTNPDGQPHRVRAAKDVGVAIQCIGRADRVEIICVSGY